MPTYTVTAYQWSGFTTYPTSFTMVIDDDDAELDWFGGDTGTPQTATFGGSTYNINGAGLLPSDIQDNDGGGGVVSEELLFMFLAGFGWVFVPMPGSVFTDGDAITGFTTGTWSDTDGVPHDDVICFAAGTQIVTDEGPKAVEKLRAGLRVKTADNGFQVVRWVGVTRLSVSKQLNDVSIRPILIRQGALGPDTPCRDTLVSPQHRVLYQGWKSELFFAAPEVLIPAKALVKLGLAERDDSLRPVTYVHVLLDNHELLVGDGLVSESLMPSEIAQTCMSSEQLKEIRKLIPNYVTSKGQAAQLARPAVRVHEALAIA